MAAGTSAGGVGVTVAAVFGLTNDPAPVPEPELPPEKWAPFTTFPKEFNVDVPGIPNAKFVGDDDQVVPPPVGYEQFKALSDDQVVPPPVA